METSPWTAAAILTADLLIRVGLSVRVVMRRRPVGVSLAWLLVVLAFPFLGAVVYLFIGELRLGTRRARRAAEIHELYEGWLTDLRARSHVDWTPLGAECLPLAMLTERTVGLPAQSGNELELIVQAQDVFASLVRDIDAAKRTCHLEFYIWTEGGSANDVAEALLRAAARGVACRVLVDAVGSKQFLRSDLARRIAQGGVQLCEALPVNLLRMLFVRFDLRMHRKIVVIDGEIAYTGSLNLVDPRYFKQDAGVGEWIDAMVRVRGPVVEALGITFLEDWKLETNESLLQLAEHGDVRPLDAAGNSVVQAAPSGPTIANQAMQDVLLMTIYAARRELVLTSPYFVPDESLLAALTSAARRGVAVTIVVPERVDSLLVRLASQAHKGDLLESGVRVMLFKGGLLHTKSITVDGEMSLFGSLNLDPRSLHLNFEITLAVYDRVFTDELRRLQQAYIDDSRLMSLEAWLNRPPAARFTENAARLLGPLL